VIARRDLGPAWWAQVTMTHLADRVLFHGEICRGEVNHSLLYIQESWTRLDDLESAMRWLEITEAQCKPR